MSLVISTQLCSSAPTLSKLTVTLAPAGAEAEDGSDSKLSLPLKDRVASSGPVSPLPPSSPPQAARNNTSNRANKSARFIVNVPRVRYAPDGHTHLGVLQKVKAVVEAS